MANETGAAPEENVEAAQAAEAHRLGHGGDRNYRKTVRAMW